MSKQILNTFAKTFVYEQFNPSNVKHIEAYVSLKKHGKQHPTLRFFLEDPFRDIPHLMESRISDAYVATILSAHTNQG